jgi:Ca2+-binding RTX toxin-like protein
MEPFANDKASTESGPARCWRWGFAFLLATGLSLAVGLASTASSKSLRPLCGGRQATIASNEHRIRGTPGPDVIVGDRGPNVIVGVGGNDVICGGFGRDRIYGDRGNDRIDGKKGNDNVHGGRGSDKVDGGADRDQILGGSGNDTVGGGLGNRDEVDGGPGDDNVEGGRGAFDVLQGGIGRDRIDGGPGSHDIASYRGAGGAIDVDLGHGVVLGAESERLIGIEDVIGGSGEDTLSGSASTRNRLDGGPGDDRLVGARLGDRAFGGPGSDQCLGRFAAEASCGPSGTRRGGTRVELYKSITGLPILTIAGDEGVDYLKIGQRRIGSATALVASLGAGNDTLIVGRSVPPGVSVTIDGGPGRDRLRGGRGDDTLYSGDDGDPDTLGGGAGDDALFGVNILHPRHRSGPAALFGGAGDDLLIGGQPCNDGFHGGGGDNDSASFARVRNAGTVVKAAIGGRAVDPGVGDCPGSRIDGRVEKIEGSTGRDVLFGAAGPDTLLGRGGRDVLDGRGGLDRCIGGRGSDQDRRCEYVR